VSKSESVETPSNLPVPLSRANVLSIIPAYKEENAIGGVVSSVLAYLDHVLVVDDGSQDRTSEIVKGTPAILIRHEVNSGKGAALKTGFRYAAQRGVAGVICLDGDGQHDPADIPKFLACANNSDRPDLVIGNRFSDPKGMPPLRYWTNRVMSGWISRLCRQRIPDTQCGFRLLRASLLSAMDLPTSGYDYESEMIFTGALMGLRIGNVPVRTIYGNEKSKIRPVHDAIRFLKLVGHYGKRCRRHFAQEN